ncbi:MAG: aldolase/citrate lyase family protein [Candidatus Bathyarchaeia archaeon]
MGGLKKKLKDGKTALGTWITINHPDVVDILSTLPFDWFVFDMEHSPLDVSNLEVLMMPLKGTEITPIVRVPWNDMVVIKRVLDVGAEGVLIPWVNSREEAEAAVRYVRYPPRGVRGVGPRRCIMYGERPFLDYYRRFEDEELVLIVQVETAKAIDSLEGILSVEGIDVAYVGPMDLSVNLGIPTMFDHPKFKEALDKVLKVCKKYGVTPGIHTFSIEQAKKYADEGFRFIALMSDQRGLTSIFKSTLSEFGRS